MDSCLFIFCASDTYYSYPGHFLVQKKYEWQLYMRRCAFKLSVITFPTFFHVLRSFRTGTNNANTRTFCVFPLFSCLCIHHQPSTYKSHYELFYYYFFLFSASFCGRGDWCFSHIKRTFFFFLLPTRFASVKFYSTRGHLVLPF